MRIAFIGRLTLPALAVVVLGLVLVLGTWQRPTPQQSIPLQLTAAAAGDSANGAFTINATAVTGLYPGATKALVLSITNPYSFDLTVTALSAKLTNTSNPQCASSSTNLVVGTYAGPPDLPIKVKSSRTVTVGSIPLLMPKTVASGCQGVNFTLSLNGTASKATS